MLRATFFAVIFIFVTNHAQSDGWEDAVTEESLRVTTAVGSEIIKFVDESLLNDRVTDGINAIIAGAYNFAGSVKDTIAAAVTQTPTENIE